jgi:hypothetical protein
MNFTAVTPTAATWLAVWPNGITGIPRPDISNVNTAKGQTVSNAAITLLGPGNKYNIYNAFGTTNVINDVVGTFYLYPGTASVAAAQAGARSGANSATRRSLQSADLPGSVFPAS